MKLTFTNLHLFLRPPRLDWREKIRRMARLLAPGKRSFPIRDLSVVFLNDAVMAQLNWRHLGHHGPTDILTFDYGSGFAEILISLDTAIREARKHDQTLQEELTLYLAHGMLHLAGFDDRGRAPRRLMKRKEKWLIHHLKLRD